MRYRFYKTTEGWFIDLKWFPFSKAWLEMVANADLLLDQLSEGKNEITLEISTTPIPFSDGKMVKYQKMEEDTLFSGRFYQSSPGYTDNKNADMDVVWLCGVTLWVFWHYPKQIYFKIVD